MVLNGNNLTLRGDIARRSIWSRLDAKRGRPWQGRTFRHPHLLEYVKQHRTEILRAVYLLGKGWLQAGRPKPTKDKLVGGFEAWLHTVGGILEHAGVPGFLDNLDVLYEQVDEEAAEWETFLEAVMKEFPDKDCSGFKSAEFTVYELATDIMDSRNRNLRDSIASLLPGTLADELHNAGFRKRLGWALRGKRDTRFGTGGLHVVRLPGARRVARWQVLKERTTEVLS